MISSLASSRTKMSKVQTWVWEKLQPEAQEQSHEVSQSGNILNLASLFFGFKSSWDVCFAEKYTAIPCFCSKYILLRLVKTKSYRVSLKKGTFFVFILFQFPRSDFTFSHVFQNHIFEPVSSSHSKNTLSEYWAP